MPPVQPLPYAHEIQVALRAAREAGATALQMQGGVIANDKADGSPVTAGDLAADEIIRHHLGLAFPADAILSEERPDDQPRLDNRRLWIVDPIDGTKNFVRGMPVWATLIALSDHDRVVVGVVSAPALGRRWWAARDEGAWTSDLDGSVRPCHVSQVSSLGDAYLSYSSLNSWPDAGEGGGIHGLLGQVWRSRAFGDFWSHVLVAEGAVDVSCEPSVSLWDIASLQVIVEEAGGRFTDLAGEAHPDRGSILCTNGLLHDAALSLLRT